MKINILNKLKKWRFDRVAETILRTKPLDYSYDKSVTIVSMVGHDTVVMYLLAIKSFMRHFGRGNVEVINDGSLTVSDIKTLEYHIPNINFSEASEINTYDGPSYISWKRLYRIQQLAESSYVIQLDSDTISLGAHIYVDDSVRANKGFLIGGKRWGKAVHVDTLKDLISFWDNNHVQVRAEKHFHKLDFFKDGTRYLRGCAGFAGYPRNFATIDEIRHLSDQIFKYVGDDWKNWGSEQTATMCLISKCKNSQILPWPEYQNFDYPETNEEITSMSLVHFIGSNRYDKGVYTKLAKLMVKNL